MSGLDDNSFTVKIVAVSTTLRKETDYCMIVQAPAAPVVITLPQASLMPSGRPYYIAKDNTATQTVTLTPNAADKIDSGTAGVGVAVGAAGTSGGCIVVSDGVSNWFRVAKN